MRPGRTALARVTVVVLLAGSLVALSGKPLVGPPMGPSWPGAWVVTAAVHPARKGSGLTRRVEPFGEDASAI